MPPQVRIILHNLPKEHPDFLRLYPTHHVLTQIPNHSLDLKPRPIPHIGRRLGTVKGGVANTGIVILALLWGQEEVGFDGVDRDEELLAGRAHWEAGYELEVVVQGEGQLGVGGGAEAAVGGEAEV